MKIEIDTDRRVLRIGTGIVLSLDLLGVLGAPDPSAMYRFRRDKHGSVTVEKLDGVWERRDEGEKPEST